VSFLRIYETLDIVVSIPVSHNLPCPLRWSWGRVCRWRCTFFVITKLVPIWCHEQLQENRWLEDLPMAIVDVMANRSPIYLDGLNQL
jgi:hypothetical protein